jgi:hypothetical protein
MEFLKRSAGAISKITQNAATAARQSTGVCWAIEASGNLRFEAHYGLKADIVPCPFCAKCGH